jgi:hypothetical protein
MRILPVLPFAMPLLVAGEHELQPPPSGMMARKIAFNSYQIQMAGQAADISSFWFGPFGDGRHHALVSCMKYRGIDLQEVPMDAVSAAYFHAEVRQIAARVAVLALTKPPVQAADWFASASTASKVMATESSRF